MDPKLVLSRKEAIPGGFLVTHHEKPKKFIGVKAWRKTSSEKFLRMTVTQRNSNPIPNFEAQRGLMEKAAKSMKPKQRGGRPPERHGITGITRFAKLSLGPGHNLG